MVPHVPNSVNSRESRSYSDHAGAGISESVKARINASFSNRSDSYSQTHPINPSSGSVSTSHPRTKKTVNQIYQTLKEDTQVTVNAALNKDDAVKKDSKAKAADLMNKLHPEASISSHDDWYFLQNRIYFLSSLSSPQPPARPSTTKAAPA